MGDKTRQRGVWFEATDTEHKSDSSAARRRAAVSFLSRCIIIECVFVCLWTLLTLALHYLHWEARFRNRAKHCELNCEVKSAAICNVSRTSPSADCPDYVLRISRGKLQIKTFVWASVRIRRLTRLLLLCVRACVCVRMCPCVSYIGPSSVTVHSRVAVDPPSLVRRSLSCSKQKRLPQTCSDWNF